MVKIRNLAPKKSADTYGCRQKKGKFNPSGGSSFIKIA